MLYQPFEFLGGDRNNISLQGGDEGYDARKTFYTTFCGIKEVLCTFVLATQSSLYTFIMIAILVRPNCRLLSLLIVII